MEGRGRKTFFFEKKNQKTFPALRDAYGGQRAPADKSFLLLFFKKAGLPFLTSNLTAWLPAC
jgi:hypothetical protein